MFIINVFHDQVTFEPIFQENIRKMYIQEYKVEDMNCLDSKGDLDEKILINTLESILDSIVDEHIKSVRERGDEIDYKNNKVFSKHVFIDREKPQVRIKLTCEDGRYRHMKFRLFNLESQFKDTISNCGEIFHWSCKGLNDKNKLAKLDGDHKQFLESQKDKKGPPEGFAWDRERQTEEEVKNILWKNLKDTLSSDNNSSATELTIYSADQLLDYLNKQYEIGKSGARVDLVKKALEHKENKFSELMQNRSRNMTEQCKGVSCYGQRDDWSQTMLKEANDLLKHTESIHLMVQKSSSELFGLIKSEDVEKLSEYYNELLEDKKVTKNKQDVKENLIRNPQEALFGEDGDFVDRDFHYDFSQAALANKVFSKTRGEEIECFQYSSDEDNSKGLGSKTANQTKNTEQSTMIETMNATKNTNPNASRQTNIFDFSQQPNSNQSNFLKKENAKKNQPKKGGMNAKKVKKNN